MQGDGIEFLLVRTRGSGRWTFPKGGAEPGLTHAQAAALEAFEEAGVHGRIEEDSFARYIRKRSSARSLAARSGEKAVAVNAYLCEVLRLRPPQESSRNRTWFSVEDAKKRLREGRKTDNGTGLARVIDKAVARIERPGSGPAGDGWQDNRPQPDQQRVNVRPQDALQEVRFDFAEAYGRLEATSMARIRRQSSSSMRQTAVSEDSPCGREVLPCEILEFSPPRWKDRALGTGTRKG
jgi:8-oxo-dGTP pyrophosphatase MutT (NUDIX family)